MYPRAAFDDAILNILLLKSYEHAVEDEQYYQFPDNFIGMCLNPLPFCKEFLSYFCAPHEIK